MGGIFESAGVIGQSHVCVCVWMSASLITPSILMKHANAALFNCIIQLLDFFIGFVLICPCRLSVCGFFVHEMCYLLTDFELFSSILGSYLKGQRLFFKIWANCFTSYSKIFMSLEVLSAMSAV